MLTVRIKIVGRDLPGRRWCRDDGSALENVHVAVQVGRIPVDLVPGNASEARWDISVDVIESKGTIDFRGSAVNGRPGERFLYLTWGNVDDAGEFEMFRRAKLMLNRAPRELISAALDGEGGLVASVGLTGADGGPRCARVEPPHLCWSLADG